jgi:hypothetical protein
LINGTVFVKNILYVGFIMLYYNIKSKINILSMSVMISLPCTYVLCMQKPSMQNPMEHNPEIVYLIPKVNERIENKNLRWKRACTKEIMWQAASLRNHFMKQRLIEEDADVEDGIKNVENMKMRGEDVSFETASMIRAYRAAQNKFGLVEENIQRKFASSMQMIVPRSSRALYTALENIVDRSPQWQLTDNEIREVQSITRIRMSCGEQGGEGLRGML